MSDIWFGINPAFYPSELITPETAERMLRRNYLNRRVNARAVDRYAARMKAGQWRESNDAICFDNRGNLINGQHRLMAVVKSGVSIRCDVKTGLDPECVYTIDTARTRSTGDAACFVHPNEPIYSSRNVQAVIYAMRRLIFAVPVNQMENEDSGDRIAALDEWMGIARFIYKLEGQGNRAPGIRRNEFFLAALCAVINGVPQETIEAFIRCCKNNVAGCEGYNVKIALDYRTEAMTNTAHNLNHRKGEEWERVLKVERAICAFHQAKTVCRLQEPYPVKFTQIAEFNARWMA